MDYRPYCVIRGGGDLGTGVAWRLTRAGWPVVVLELPNPLTVRRTVALSSAVTEGEVNIEGMIGKRVASIDEATCDLSTTTVPVLVSETRAEFDDLINKPDVVIDARMAKRNIDTTIDDARLVIGLGPGFTAGQINDDDDTDDDNDDDDTDDDNAIDCHAVVETMRGHHLGRVIWSGSAQPNTSIPAPIGDHAADRVVRAGVDGVVNFDVDIGAVVKAGDVIGSIQTAADSVAPVTATISGVLRGAIRNDTHVNEGIKIGDIDPRCDPSACYEISDKALAVGGGVVEAIHTRRPI